MLLFTRRGLEENELDAFLLGAEGGERGKLLINVFSSLLGSREVKISV